MVTLTQSLEKWLTDNHSDIRPLIQLGHVELFTNEMAREYIEWCRTDEGRQYLKGGSRYENSERNRRVEETIRDNDEHCVCCDAVIPEGRQVCPACERG